jgi:hypothetical protein
METRDEAVLTCLGHICCSNHKPFGHILETLGAILSKAKPLVHHWVSPWWFLSLRNWLWRICGSLIGNVGGRRGEEGGVGTAGTVASAMGGSLGANIGEEEETEQASNHETPQEGAKEVEPQCE